MKKTVINNRWKWILGGTIIVLVCIGLAIDELFISKDLQDLYGRGVAILVAPIAVPWLIHEEIKDMPTIEITDEYIYARYPNRLQRGYVDLQVPVYYTFYTKQGDFGKFILLSNDPITDEQEIMRFGINYSTQVSIHYTKKVKKIMPREDWIEVNLKNNHTI